MSFASSLGGARWPYFRLYSTPKFPFPRPCCPWWAVHSPRCRAAASLVAALEVSPSCPPDPSPQDGGAWSLLSVRHLSCTCSRSSAVSVVVSSTCSSSIARAAFIPLFLSRPSGAWFAIRCLQCLCFHIFGCSHVCGPSHYCRGIWNGPPCPTSAHDAVVAGLLSARSAVCAGT